jgi:hypothetical protein
MKVMTMHSSSARAREATPHARQTTKAARIITALKQRVLTILNDPSIPQENRALLRYALEINDPSLARMVAKMEGEQTHDDELYQRQSVESNHDEPSENKIEILVDLICRPGDEPETKSAALVVLLSTLERAEEPAAVANSIKHVALAHCEELTFDDMVDARVAAFEDELFAGRTSIS